MQGVGTAYGSLPIPYGVALFTDETVFVCRFLGAQLLLIFYLESQTKMGRFAQYYDGDMRRKLKIKSYLSLYFNPTRQLLISTKGMICHWFHALSGSFLS